MIWKCDSRWKSNFSICLENLSRGRGEVMIENWILSSKASTPLKLSCSRCRRRRHRSRIAQPKEGEKIRKKWVVEEENTESVKNVCDFCLCCLFFICHNVRICLIYSFILKSEITALCSSRRCWKKKKEHRKEPWKAIMCCLGWSSYLSFFLPSCCVSKSPRINVFWLRYFIKQPRYGMVGGLICQQLYENLSTTRS